MTIINFVLITNSVELQPLRTHNDQISETWSIYYAARISLKIPKEFHRKVIRVKVIRGTIEREGKRVNERVRKSVRRYEETKEDDIT